MIYAAVTILVLLSPFAVGIALIDGAIWLSNITLPKDQRW